MGDNIDDMVKAIREKSPREVASLREAEQNEIRLKWQYEALMEAHNPQKSNVEKTLYKISEEQLQFHDQVSRVANNYRLSTEALENAHPDFKNLQNQVKVLGALTKDAEKGLDKNAVKNAVKILVSNEVESKMQAYKHALHDPKVDHEGLQQKEKELKDAVQKAAEKMKIKGVDFDKVYGEIKNILGYGTQRVASNQRMQNAIASANDLSHNPATRGDDDGVRAPLVGDLSGKGTMAL